LRSIGISPNMIIARSDYPTGKDLCDKIALFCDVERQAVVPMVTSDVLYEIPLLLEKAGVGDYLVQKLNMKATRVPDMKPWQKLVERVRKPKPTVKVALVGKYVELQDAYMSVREALKHAALHNDVDVEIGWVHSVDLERDKGWDIIQNSDAILVPGGFGSRGIEGKILAARYARERKVPYLGLCLGMQTMCIDFARGALNHEDANSSEFDRSTEYPVIDLMIDQRSITDMGGTMRLGLYPCELKEGSKAAEAYGVDQVEERHRHRFEFNNAYREIAEIKDHPFMVGSQFHPEFLSRPMRPHPLFVGLIKAAKHKNGKK
jgi:CTP synthase